MSWKLTIRRGPKVSHERHDTLSAALDAVDAEIAATDRIDEVTALGRNYLPVVTRIELKGPNKVRGGVDVRGDGTVLAWRGGLRKEPLDTTLREALQSVSVEP